MDQAESWVYRVSEVRYHLVISFVFLFSETYDDIANGVPCEVGFVIDGLFVTCEELKILVDECITGWTRP